MSATPPVSVPDNGQASTGIQGLDDVMIGGFPRRRMYLVAGNPGTGKTTLGLQFLLEGLRRGEAGLYVTLSETTEELRAVAKTHGWSLDGLSLYEAATLADGGAKPDAHYTLFHPAEVELGEITHSICEEIERTSAVRVVFDSLSEMRLLAREPLRYRREILSLKQFFAQRRCTVLVLDDHYGEVRDFDLQSLVHGVLALEHQPIEFGADRRRLRILKLRGVAFRGGYHDVVIRTGGLVVFPRLVAAEHPRVTTTEQVSGGVAAVDALLGGGLDRGTSTLVLGPAGAGKSALVLQFTAAAITRGEGAAVYLFDENLATCLTRAAGLGVDIRAPLDSGLLTVTQIDPAELAPGEFADMVLARVAAGARVVVLDSLNGYLSAMPGERLLVLHIHELLTYLARQGVVTLLTVSQHGVLDSSISTPVNVTYLADTVVLLRYFEAEGKVRQAISVMKRRSGTHERTIREFRLTAAGIEVGAPLTEFQGILTGVPTYVGSSVPLLGRSEQPNA
jgi:circadian clock protein KaiC